jgi:hypothetical protein
MCKSKGKNTIVIFSYHIINANKYIILNFDVILEHANTLKSHYGKIDSWHDSPFCLVKGHIKWWIDNMTYQINFLTLQYW